jgi:hypothetical protein
MNDIILTEEKVWRNASEYWRKPIATFEDMKADSLQTLAKKITQESWYTTDMMFAVKRGNMYIFQNILTGSNYMPLDWYIKGTAWGVREKGLDT